MKEYNIETLNQLEEQASRLDREGNYREALNCAEQALEFAEYFFSPVHGRVASCYSSRAYFRRILCLYEESEADYRHSINITEKEEGKESPQLYGKLAGLASLYQDLGRYKEAEDLLQRAIQILLKTKGTLHIDLPVLLNNLGIVLYRQSRFQDAEMQYKKAIKKWNILKGPDSPESAFPMSNLGELYLDQGKYTEAEKYIMGGLEILRKDVFTEHISLAPFYHNQGKLYSEKGDYQHSLDAHQKALSIRRRVLGENHPDTALSLQCVAAILKNLGKYHEAQHLYLEALEIYEKTTDGTHPDIPTNLNNLALIYQKIGDDERAKHYLSLAMETKTKFQGSEHYNMLVYHINMANLCCLKEDFQKALDHCEHARGMLDNLVEPDSIKWAVLYNTMAHIFNKKENYIDAEKYLKKSIAIHEGITPPNPEGLSASIGNLARMYQDDNNYEKAEVYLKRAVQIIEEGISPDHPDLLPSLLNLASLRVVKGHYPSAISLFKRILSIQDKYIDTVFRFGGEEQKLEFISHMSTAYLATISAIHGHILKENPKSVEFALETVLRRKGVVLDAEARTHEAYQRKLTGPMKDIWNTRTEKLSLLAKLIQPIPEKKENSTLAEQVARSKLIKTIQKEIENLERQLKNEASSELGVMVQSRVTLKDITTAMPDRSALLEFVRIQDFNFSTSKTPWGMPRYIVFILRKNGTINMVDLGNTGYINMYIQPALQGIRWATENATEALYELGTTIWAPLEYYLDDIERIIISPDGLINLIPFAAILDTNWQYLIEKYTISYVTSGRDLIPSPRKQHIGEHQLVLAADPDYDSQESIRNDSGEAVPRGGLYFPMKRLKGTLKEAEIVPPLVPIDDTRKKIITGKEATKDAILNTVNPGILHLATHGFYNSENMSGITSKPLPFSEMMDGMIDYYNKKAHPEPSQPQLTSRRNRTLTESGLALAGANLAGKDPNNTNGLLTGLEITSMELSGTEMVVLSACDTGFGEYIPGEGIFGLRRAFALAGAKNLVMSLWLVSDQWTMKQMKMFYRNLQKMPPADALREAQLKTIEALEEWCAPLPRLWAPFIVQGGRAQLDSVYDAINPTI
jgi:CHAT domain-containing protein/Tfp pilus assembly protein PilF